FGRSSRWWMDSFIISAARLDASSRPRTKESVMSVNATRREFLQTAAGGAVLGFADLGFLSKLPVISAAETQLDPKMVRVGSELEPLVRLLETTPQNQLLEAVGEKIRHGTSYREVLGALLLASVRNVQP